MSSIRLTATNSTKISSKKYHSASYIHKIKSRKSKRRRHSTGSNSIIKKNKYIKQHLGNIIDNENIIYDIYLFDKLSSSIINKVKDACQPKFDEESVEEYSLKDPDYYKFILLNKKTNQVLGFIICKYMFTKDNECFDPNLKCIYIKLLCLHERERGKKLFKKFYFFVEHFLKKRFNPSCIRLTASDREVYNMYINFGFTTEMKTNFTDFSQDCEYSLIKRIKS